MSKKLTHEFIAARTKSERLENIKNINFWGNELDDISIVRKMQNLEVVSLSVNNITTLQDFSYLKNLKELYLRKNLISEISELEFLKTCDNLRVLWLSENPISEIKNYRLIVLNILPQLTKLDDTVFSPDERRQANSLDISSIISSNINNKFPNQVDNFQKEKDDIQYNKDNKDKNDNVNFYNYNRDRNNNFKDNEDTNNLYNGNNLKINNNPNTIDNNIYNYKNVQLPIIQNNNNLYANNKNSANNLYNKNLDYENLDNNNFRNERNRRMFSNEREISSGNSRNVENEIDDFLYQQNKNLNHYNYHTNNNNQNINASNQMVYKYNRRNNNSSQDPENYLNRRLENVNINEKDNIPSNNNELIYERKKSSRKYNNGYQEENNKYNGNFTPKMNDNRNTSTNVLNCILMLLREMDDKDLIKLKNEVDRRLMK